MKRLSKRSWALALALAMILSLFSGLSAKAARPGDENYTGLCASWPAQEWLNGKPQKQTDPYSYNADMGMEVRNTQVMYLGESKDQELTILDVENLVVTEWEDVQQVVNPEDYSIEPFTYYDEDTKREEYANGFFNVRFEKTGEYRIRRGDDYLKLEVNLPEVGIYDNITSDVGIDNLVMDNNQVIFPKDSENVYYLRFLDENNVQNIRFNKLWAERFGEKYEEIKIINLGYYARITIPERTYDFFDIVIDATITYSNGETRYLDRRIAFDPQKEGLLVADPDWREDGPHFRNEIFDYQYSREAELKQRTIISLAFANEGELQPLNDLSNLHIFNNNLCRR